VTGPTGSTGATGPTGPTGAAAPSDHGLLTGLSDDDHAQYLLANGTRNLTGDLTISSLSTTLIWNNGSGPHGFEMNTGTASAFESALYYRTGTNTWSFEDASANIIASFDSGTREVIVGTSFFANGISTDVANTTTNGLSYIAGETLAVARSGGVSGVFGRNTSDGNVMLIQQGGTTEGVVSVSGTTVTWGTFAGSHWSQLEPYERIDIKRGTVMETIDIMCHWDGEENEQLPKCKVSDTVASNSVYGVFMMWDNDDETFTSDLFIIALGAYMIRIAPGISVSSGDLLESNGDGCARPQPDSIFRASTIGKVSSTNIIETFEDGSYLVPCTLHCG
jgi:hypothetical protein